jgi:hypothetical protein
LHGAKKEIEDTGEVSRELKQRIFAMMPGFEALWSALDELAHERVDERDVVKMFRKLSPHERSWTLAMSTVTNGIAFLEQLGKRRWTNVTEVATGQHAIPNDEALDKILRYETAIDRGLGRALDRLDRPQSRRSGERLPPPLSVRVTQ